MEPRLRILRKERGKVVFDDDDVGGGDGGESGVGVDGGGIERAGNEMGEEVDW